VKNLNKQQLLAVAVILVLTVTAAAYRWAASAGPPREAVQVKKSEPGVKKEQPKIYVHVTGAVARPGLYPLPRGSRVNDAVRAAGPTGKAYLDYLNLAEILTDGQKITVPSKEEIEQISRMETVKSNNGSPGQAGTLAGANLSATAAVPGGGRVNLNLANLIQLDGLPGIGPALAQRILEYRQQNGGFRSVQELKKVTGIGEKKFEKLKDLVSI